MEAKPDVRSCVAPRRRWRLAPDGNWRHLRASPLPVRVSVVLAPAEFRAGAAVRAVVFFASRPSSSGTMATDSWALAVDKQEAAVKSVSGFRSRRGERTGGPKPTLLGVQGAPWVGQAVAHTPLKVCWEESLSLDLRLRQKRPVWRLFLWSGPVKDFYPVANLSLLCMLSFLHCTSSVGIVRKGAMLILFFIWFLSDCLLLLFYRFLDACLTWLAVCSNLQNNRFRFIFSVSIYRKRAEALQTVSSVFKETFNFIYWFFD